MFSQYSHIELLGSRHTLTLLPFSTTTILFTNLVSLSTFVITSGPSILSSSSFILSLGRMEYPGVTAPLALSSVFIVWFPSRQPSSLKMSGKSSVIHSGSSGCSLLWGNVTSSLYSQIPCTSSVLYLFHFLTSVYA